MEIEQEKTIGEEDYFPLDVVIQSVRNDKGTKVSDDIRRLVFRDIKYSVRLGTKFRFSYNFDINEPEGDKDVWLATNKDSTSPTGQVVISRCNGTLGSIYTDEKGVSHYHYEPVICSDTLSSVNLNYNEAIIIPQAQITLTTQHNQFTKNYYINQRFVIGYDRVYKIKGINKANSLKTFNPYDVGLVILYAELDEISSKDDFETRIAFNEADTPPVINVEPMEYDILIYEPYSLPINLTKTPILFKVGVFNGEELLGNSVTVNVSIPNCSNANLYFDFIDNGDNSFYLSKKQTYNKENLLISCSASSPTGELLTKEYEIGLKGVI